MRFVNILSGTLPGAIDTDDYETKRTRYVEARYRAVGSPDKTVASGAVTVTSGDRSAGIYGNGLRLRSTRTLNSVMVPSAPRINPWPCWFL